MGYIPTNNTNKLCRLFYNIYNNTQFIYLFSSSSNNEVINIHELHCVPYNINSDNFLNQWENNLKNKYNNIIYIEKIPIKNGIIYILIDDYGNKEVRTHYYKNGTVYTTCTYFKDPKVTLNKLKTFSYKAIESIYPF